MKIINILNKSITPFSFEFFPPKTDSGWEKLFTTIAELKSLKPAYVSVTYGAGGTTRENTHKLVQRITTETDLTVVAHLTCVGSTKKEVASIIDEYLNIGVHNILALRGDAPQGSAQWSAAGGEFHHASDLIRFIRSIAPEIGIAAACFPEGHPDTPNRLQEIEYLKQKVDAGVDYLVTQLFFDNRDYFDFMERCRLAGIDVPIIAGIMPVTSAKGMVRMAELAAGSRIPASLLKSVNRAEKSGKVKDAGIHWASEQIRELIDKGCSGIHLYTLNNSDASLRICDSLGLKDYSFN